MASLSKRVAAALQREFIEGTIFRVDLDHVDVAPAGSSGILRSLPLTGDRDKVQPGDPVRIITVAGERVALVGDVALDNSAGEIVEDASAIELDEKLANINFPSQESSSGESASDAQINDGWVFTGRMYSANWTNKVVSTTAKTAINVVSEFGLPQGVEAVIVRLIAKDSGSGANPDLWTTVAKSALAYEGTTTAFVGGLLNNAWSEGSGVVGVNEDGTIYYQVRASGTNTMTVNLEIWGYKLPAFEMGSGGAGWIYLNSPLVSTAWDGDMYSTVGGRTALNVSSVFGVPAGAKAVLVRVAAKDSASATSTTCSVGIWSDATAANAAPLWARPGGLANNSWAEGYGVVSLDSSGNLYYQITASGASTMSIWMQIYGYYLGEESTAQGWVFFDQPVQAPNWNPATVQTNTSTGTPINFLTEFNLPAGTKAVIVRAIAYDAGSAAATDQWFGLQSVSSSSAIMPFLVRTNGLTNNARGEEQGIVPLDDNGNVYWKCTGATGSGMGVYLRVVGYLLPTSATRTTAENLQGYEPDPQPTANAHVPVTDANGYLNAAGANLTSANLTNLNVSGAGNFPWLARAPFNMTGGGTLQVQYYNSAYYVKWSARFIVISNGRSSNACPSGYFNIDMPPAGTSVPGYGNAATRTVDATYGILLGSWEALYYEIPLTSGATGLASNFRVVHYGADFAVPANWILICVCNGDTPFATYFWPANGGITLSPATDIDTKKPTQVGINYVVDGGGSVITAGTKGAITVPYSFLVDGVQLLADVSGSATVNLYYGTYTAYNASMTLFGTFTLASAIKNQIAVGNSLIPGDYILRFDVSGVTSITRLTIGVFGSRGL